MIKPDTRGAGAAHESFNATYYGAQQTKSRETLLFFASLAVAAECRCVTDEEQEQHTRVSTACYIH
jgi:hypothetical protein